MGCNTSAEMMRNYQNPNPQIVSMTNSTAWKKPTVDLGPMDRRSLIVYLELDKQIASSEAENPGQLLELKAKRLDQLNLELEKQQQELKELEKLVTQDLGGGANQLNEESVKNALMEISNAQDGKVVSDQEEYFALLNKEEMARKAIEAGFVEKVELEQQVKELSAKAELLNTLYRQQDEHLDWIFGREYGSAEENMLEAQLDVLEERRAAIVQADALWRQGRMQVEYACQQLGSAVDLWAGVLDVSPDEADHRFKMAAETRDNLVAAGQNLLGAHQNLYNVTFPFCTLDEIKTLGKATAYVFTDMQSAARHGHAMQCYKATFLRAGALLQWMDQVINATIARDLSEITNQAKEKTLALRMERVRLIQNKLKEDLGEEEMKAVMAEVMLNDDQVLISDQEIDPNANLTENSHPKIPVKDLPPPPSTDEIFGQIDLLAKEHQQELERYLYGMETTQGRLNQTLQVKLTDRRQRRARLKLDDAERAGMAVADKVV